MKPIVNLAREGRAMRRKKVYWCIVCGREFKASMSNAIFCSGACRTLDYRRKKLLRETSEKLRWMDSWKISSGQ